MKKLKMMVIALALSLALLAGCTQQPAPAGDGAAQPGGDTQPDGGSAQPAGDVDWQNFQIDPAQIPQEVLDTELNVAVFIRNIDNPYYVSIVEGMELFSAYLDSIGQNHTVQAFESTGNNATELNNVRQFTARAGANGIAMVDPNEAATAPSTADAFSNAGGFMGTIWSRPDDVGPLDFTPNWVVHNSPDDATNGYITARALFEAMGGSGTVFVLEGMLGNTAAIERRIGFDRAYAEFPDITIAHEDTANWLTTEALALVETWLNVTPDVGGIWCANDGMATGALQALGNVGRRGEVFVTGIDGNEDIVEAVRAGDVVATISSNAHLQSGFTLAITYAAWAGLLDVSALPDDFREFSTPTILITADNVEAFISEMPQFDFSHIFRESRVDN